MFQYSLGTKDLKSAFLYERQAVDHSLLVLDSSVGALLGDEYYFNQRGSRQDYNQFRLRDLIILDYAGFATNTLYYLSCSLDSGDNPSFVNGDPSNIVGWIAFQPGGTIQTQKSIGCLRSMSSQPLITIKLKLLDKNMVPIITARFVAIFELIKFV